MKATRLVLIVLLLVSCCVPLFAVGGSGCENCKFSPNHWGFCRAADPGYTWCNEIVVDPTTGQTSCDHPAVSDCSSDGGNDSCIWTDQNGNCILYY